VGPKTDKVLRLARPALAVGLCGGGAWLLTLVNWDKSSRVLVPFAYLAIILLLGALYGRTVGILGSIVAALVFAHSLFAPVGSLQVSQQDSRASLAWMLLTGVALSFLLLPSNKEGGQHGSK
jgi:K+-sensing histidine kinase KdpD